MQEISEIVYWAAVHILALFAIVSNPGFFCSCRMHFAQRIEYLPAWWLDL